MERYAKAGADSVKAQWSVDQLFYLKGCADRMGMGQASDIIGAIAEY